MPRAYRIYDQTQLYFTTFTVVRWIKVFDYQENCEVFLDSIRYCQEHKGLEVYAWCIMPHHAHLILGTNGKMKLEGIIRDLKSYTSRMIRKNMEERGGIDLSIENKLHYFLQAGESNTNNYDFQLWQQPYHAVELSTNKILDQCLDYLHYNPVEAGLSDTPEEWKWSSAIDYYGGEGLLEIKFIE